MEHGEARGIRLAGVGLVWAGVALAIGGALAALIRFEQNLPGAELFKSADGAPQDGLFSASIALHGGLMTLAPTTAIAAAAMGLVVARGGWRLWLLWPARLLLLAAIAVGLASVVTALAPLLPSARQWMFDLKWLLSLFWQYVFVSAPFLLIAAGVATAPATRRIGTWIRNVLAVVALFCGLRWIWRSIEREMTLGGPDDSWREFILAEGAQDGRMLLAALALSMAIAVFTRRGWARDPAAPYIFLGGLLVAGLWVVLLPDLAIFHDPLLELAPVHSIYGALLIFVGYAVAFQWVVASGRWASAGISWLHALALAVATFAMSAPWAMLGEYGMPRRTIDYPAELTGWNESASTIAATVIGLQAIGLLHLIAAAFRRPTAEPIRPKPELTEPVSEPAQTA